MEFLRYPHLIPTLFNGCGFGPPLPFTAASAWTWIGHPVSGLLILTFCQLRWLCAVNARFHFGSAAWRLNLASMRNSPDRSTKSTRSCLLALPQLVDTGFQVLFHSPPGVLFTFPSQYCALSVTGEYLAFRGGPRIFLQGFTCPAVLRILPGWFLFHVRGSHPLWPAFPCLFRYISQSFWQSLPRYDTHTGLG